MQILVPLKWTATRTEVEPLSASASVEPGRYGLDPSSVAALMWALRLAGSDEAEVTAVTAGSPAADAGLREALALGADRAIRVEAPAGVASLDVAAALAPLAGKADLVVAGARSMDRGSAAVAPALGAMLGRPAACGLLSVEWHGGTLLAERRLPAGRREHVRLAPPAVISMEAATVELPRAPLPAVLAAAEAEIDVVITERPLEPAATGTAVPYRPRPRTVPAPPAGDLPRERIAALSGALDAGSGAQQVELPPEEAAVEIVATLRRWGYLEPEG